MLLLFVSLYLLYYCNYYLVIDINDISCGQFKRG